MTDLEGWDADIPRPIFFLSYAHSPRGAGRPRSVSNLWEAKLFRDLCDAVTDLSGWDEDEAPGFMDSGLNVGEGWSERISEALAHCRVFVPLYSQHYFKSQACGQEWAAFGSREVLSVTPGGGVPSAVVPVQWILVQEKRLPPVAKALQFDHQAFGDRYRTEGMQPLLKVSSFRSDYQLAVYRLAQRIVDVAEQTRVRIGVRRDFQDYDTVFPPAQARKTLRVYSVACDVEHLPEGRSRVGYGPAPEDWRPFPTHHESLARIAVAEAKEWEFHASLGSFEEMVEAALAGHRPEAPGLLLLDRWTLLDERTRELLRRLDSRDPTWMGLLEPWNATDPECAARHEELRDLALRTLINLRAHRTQRARLRGVDVITSLDEFVGVVPHVAMNAVRGYEELEPPESGAHSANGQVPAPRPNLRDERVKGPEPPGQNADPNGTPHSTPHELNEPDEPPSPGPGGETP